MPSRIPVLLGILKEEIQLTLWARRYRKWARLTDKLVKGDAWDLFALVGRLNYQFKDILQGAEFKLLLEGMRISYGEGPLRREEARPCRIQE